MTDTQTQARRLLERLDSAREGMRIVETALSGWSRADHATLARCEADTALAVAKQYLYQCRVNYRNEATEENLRRVARSHQLWGESVIAQARAIVAQDRESVLQQMFCREFPEGEGEE